LRQAQAKNARLRQEAGQEPKLQRGQLREELVCYFPIHGSTVFFHPMTSATKVWRDPSFDIHNESGTIHPLTSATPISRPCLVVVGGNVTGREEKRDGSEPPPMTAPVGHSVHRMGCVFHLPLYLTLTNILLVNFFGCCPLLIFPQSWPPYYPPT
jgi:hypothetical protein